MSVVSDERAIVSLGCTCQTAHQLNAHTDLFGGEESSGYFDWLIAPSEAVANLFDLDLPAPRPTETILSAGRPMYKGVLLYHEHVVSRHKHRITEDSEKEAHSKIKYIAAKMREWRSRDVLYVWSNTQHNIPHLKNDSLPNLEVVLTDEMVERIVASVTKWHGPSAKFLFVTSPSRSRVDEKSGRVSVRHIPIHSQAWEGDESSWREVLRQFV